MRHAMLALALAAAAPLAHAGECEDNFRKSGTLFTGADYASQVSVPQLSVKHALGQLRGIMIAEKMDVITEDLVGGSMLVEQRSTSMTRAVPILINVSDSGGAATIELTVKTEKGQFARQDSMRDEVCRMLAQVQGGKAGIAAAARGAKAQNSADVTTKDVYVFSREIAREAKGNALAVTARHRGRQYALKGEVGYVQEDGADYNVSFKVPDQRDVAIRVPGDDAPRVGVACLFRQNQLANVLTFRKGDRANFTGTFLRYDDAQRTFWLENCRQTVAKK